MKEKIFNNKFLIIVFIVILVIVLTILGFNKLKKEDNVLVNTKWKLLKYELWDNEKVLESYDGEGAEYTFSKKLKMCHLDSAICNENEYILNETVLTLINTKEKIYRDFIISISGNILTMKYELQKDR